MSKIFNIFLFQIRRVYSGITSQYYIFFICILISIFIWLTIKLSNNYEGEVLFPIELINIPDDIVLLDNKDYFISIIITAKGFSLFKYNMSDDKYLNVDLNNLPRVYKQGSNNVVLSVNSIRDKILSQLSSDIEILSMKPDTLFLKYGKMYSKKVPVVHQLKISYMQQYGAYGEIRTVPDSIIISGAKQDIIRIREIFTEVESIDNVEKNINQKMNLLIPESKFPISLSDTESDVSIKVEKYTEGRIVLPIKVVSKSKIKLKLFPSKAEIIYKVALKDYKDYKEYDVSSLNDFKISVNYDIDKSNDDKLVINVVKIPENISITNIKPKNVEYIILK